MRKQLPEQKVPSREEQIRELLKKISENEAFSRIRGKFDDGPAEIVKTSKSPSHFCKVFDQRASDVKIFGNMLTKFKRDGWVDAFNELKTALTVSDYFIEGEKINLNKTKLVTLVILDFPKTLSMISWIRAGHWMDLDEILDNGLEPEHRSHSLARAMFAQFPSLKKHSLNRRNWHQYEGRDLLEAYQEDVVTKFRNSLTKLPKETIKLETAWGTYNDHLEIAGSHTGINDKGTFGYLVPLSQKETLKLFTREQQKNIITWQCRVPVEMFENGFVVGFHPEERHLDREELATKFSVSKNCSHGYGAIFLPKYIDRADYSCNFHRSVSGGGMIDLEEGEKMTFMLEPSKK